MWSALLTCMRPPVPPVLAPVMLHTPKIVKFGGPSPTSNVGNVNTGYPPARLLSLYGTPRPLLRAKLNELWPYRLCHRGYIGS